MTLLAFSLSMPSNNSWNGRWSGEGREYVVVKNLPNSAKGAQWANSVIDDAPYRYDFGDGWAASISVKVVDSSEGRRLRRVSAGFCGYDWMIESILADQTIKAPIPRVAAAREP